MFRFGHLCSKCLLLDENFKKKANIIAIMIEIPSELKALNQGTKVIIEAGHIYTDEMPGLEHTISANIGSQIGKFMSSLGYSVENWLFVDNYNPQFSDNPEILDLDSYKVMLQEAGFIPDKIVFEADLVPSAQENLDILVQNNYAQKNCASINLLKKVNKEKQVLFNMENGHYSCSLLDASFYVQKASQGNILITVLPEKFKSEQKQTMTIISKLQKSGVNISSKQIASLYFSDQNGYQPGMVPEIFCDSQILVVNQSVSTLNLLNNIASGFPGYNQVNNLPIQVVLSAN